MYLTPSQYSLAGVFSVFVTNRKPESKGDSRLKEFSIYVRFLNKNEYIFASSKSIKKVVHAHQEGCVMRINHPLS